MSDKLTLPMWEPVQAHKAMTAQLWPLLKSHLMAGRRMTLELRPEKRSDAENRMLHAMLGYISKNVEWAGKKRSIDVWKRLLTAAWCRATNEHVEILPAVDGHGVDIVFRRTSELSRAECAELITFIQAWCAQSGIPLPPHPSEPQYFESTT